MTKALHQGLFVIFKYLFPYHGKKHGKNVLHFTRVEQSYLHSTEYSEFIWKRWAKIVEFCRVVFVSTIYTAVFEILEILS
jgi:hypothetical protein